jgi:hemolysin III
LAAPSDVIWRAFSHCSIPLTGAGLDMTHPGTVGERTADTIVHVAGVTAGLVAVIAMLARAVGYLPSYATACLVVYGIGLIAMLGCSAAYHVMAVPAWTGVLQRCDHAAIFLKIAGTYTPFAVVKMGGIAGYGLLISVWAIALVGAGAKFLLASTWDRLAILLYLALGWAGLSVIQPLIASVPAAALLLLGLGGVLYSVGVIFHVWSSLPYRNAIWHLFVLAGTACHFGAVTNAIFA